MNRVVREDDLPAVAAELVTPLGIKKEFEASGVTPHLVIQVQQRLCNWLTNHIGNEDKKIGTFLKEKM